MILQSKSAALKKKKNQIFKIDKIIKFEASSCRLLGGTSTFFDIALCEKKAVP